ncbi:oligosaccharide repeat unit polymerase [Candidatus Shikimatogenerans silvanidophilus]|uniref:oligosaccharide repeat unit polymerase n=1 Tax=Candidatus Shikimatogenerans silvanidophilus TaxID=2782547 RepID=UPI001BACC773|nr:oligosaccharide repeat unit polymerase [Candidatus Shikimatogenerans silvanidophilus]
MKKYIVLILKYIVVFFIIYINFFLTKKSIFNKNFKKKYEINTYENYNYINLVKKCIISGLLHSNWVDFFINMFLFYNYSNILLKNINILTFLIIYFSSIFFVNIIMYFLKIRTNYVNSHGGISCIMYITSLINPIAEAYIFPISIKIWLLTIFSTFYFGFFLKNYLKFLHILGSIFGIIFLLFLKYKFFIYNFYYSTFYLGVYYSILILTPIIYIFYYKLIKVFFI